MHIQNPLNTGEFKERDCGRWFTYRPTVNPWARAHGLTHEIDVLDGVRFAIVRKTVAQICTDESAEGLPVCERWSLAKNNSFIGA